MSNVSSAKKTGRPPKDTEAVNVRMDRAMLAKVDAWAEKHKTTRPAAVRGLIEAAVQLGGLDD